MSFQSKRRLTNQRRTSSWSHHNSGNTSRAQATTDPTNGFVVDIQRSANFNQAIDNNYSRPNLLMDNRDNHVNFDLEDMDIQDMDVTFGRDYSQETMISNLKIQEFLIIKEQNELLENRNHKFLQIQWHKEKIMELEQGVNHDTCRLNFLEATLLQVRDSLTRLSTVVSNFTTGAVNFLANFIAQPQQPANPPN